MGSSPRAGQLADLPPAVATGPPASVTDLAGGDGQAVGLGLGTAQLSMPPTFHVQSSSDEASWCPGARVPVFEIALCGPQPPISEANKSVVFSTQGSEVGQGLAQ